MPLMGYDELLEIGLLKSFQIAHKFITVQSTGVKTRQNAPVFLYMYH